MHRLYNAQGVGWREVSIIFRYIKAVGLDHALYNIRQLHMPSVWQFELSPNMLVYLPWIC